MLGAASNHKKAECPPVDTGDRRRYICKKNNLSCL